MYGSMYEVMLNHRLRQLAWEKNASIYRALEEQARIRRQRRLKRLAGATAWMCRRLGGYANGLGQRLEQRFQIAEGEAFTGAGTGGSASTARGPEEDAQSLSSPGKKTSGCLDVRSDDFDLRTS